MNIVIFGPDNSGKTTLSKTLLNRYTLADKKCSVVHSPGPVEVNKLIEFMNTELLDAGSDEVKIFDRFPLIEESIYGPIIRGENRLSEYSDEIFNKVDKFIYCNPGILRIVNWGSREQMDGVKDNIFEIVDRYNKLAIDLVLKGYDVIEYNYAEHIEDKNLIIRALQDLKYEFNNMKNEYNPSMEYSDLVIYINRLRNIIDMMEKERSII